MQEAFRRPAGPRASSCFDLAADRSPVPVEFIFPRDIAEMGQLGHPPRLLAAGPPPADPELSSLDLGQQPPPA